MGPNDYQKYIDNGLYGRNDDALEMYGPKSPSTRELSRPNSLTFPLTRYGQIKLGKKKNTGQKKGPDNKKFSVYIPAPNIVKPSAEEEAAIQAAYDKLKTSAEITRKKKSTKLRSTPSLETLPSRDPSTDKPHLS